MEAQKYLSFVGNAIRASTKQCDDYFDNNRSSIKFVAKRLLSNLRVARKPIYRGIILPKSKVLDGRVASIDHIKFLSFSTNRAKALDFAYIYPEYKNVFESRGDRDLESYLITYTPEPDEIIYHWKWAEPIGLRGILARHDWTPEEIEFAFAQEEVLLEDYGKSFKVDRVDWSKEDRIKVAPRFK